MFGEITAAYRTVILVGSLIALTGGISGAYFWHTSKVNTAVNTAVQRIELEQAKRNLKLQERSQESSQALEESLSKLKKDKDAKIQSANASYASLLSWVRSQAYSPGSSGSNTNSTSNPEATAEPVFGILYRKDAEALAGYSSAAEVIRLELQSCYSQYDALKDTLDNFRKDNQGKNK